MPAGRETAPAAGTVGFSLRAAEPEDLPACRRIWRTALNDYFVRRGLPSIPAESVSVTRLHAHALATDPTRFVVAQRPAVAGREERSARSVRGAEPGAGAGPGAGARRGDAPSPPQPDEEDPGGELAGFASAVVRGQTWFLSMLFVEPRAQGSGLGRALLERVLPAPQARSELRLALVSDSAQPVANGLYASLGIVPHLPIWNLVGRPAAGSLPALPDGVRAAPDDEPAWSEPDVGGLDHEVLGFAHPEDHRFARESGRRRFLYRTGSGRLAGYGYAAPIGHLGPVAVRDPALLAPVLGHLLTAVQPRGASSVWLPGAASEATRLLVRAGLRMDGFPVLICWSRPFADFARYVPQSPGLL